ncbi:MAG: aminopeptidase [Ignavibacteriales bacterium]|nr:aminopeptidase [Ignavibacteriales bacterium]
MLTSPELFSSAQVAVRDCVGVKADERVLVVTDEPLRTIGYALWEAAKSLGCEVLMVEILPRQTNGEEPPVQVAELMKAVDVVFCPTSKSLTHTDSRRAASAQGVRVVTLPGVTEEIMVRCMNADYARIAERTLKLCSLMEKTSVVRVRAPRGTDITLPIKGRAAHASTGLFREKGQWGNLPTGESYLAPLEGQSNGIVVVDGSMASIGLVKTPIRIEAKDGYATNISGGKEAEKLIELLEPHGKPARNVAEFGVGTNDKAILTGNILEDEKVMGTIHIAFGDNKSMGGTVRVASHLDGLIKEPTVWLDETKIMQDGKFVIEV